MLYERKRIVIKYSLNEFSLYTITLVFTIRNTVGLHKCEKSHDYVKYLINYAQFDFCLTS